MGIILRLFLIKGVLRWQIQIKEKIVEVGY